MPCSLCGINGHNRRSCPFPPPFQRRKLVWVAPHGEFDEAKKKMVECTSTKTFKDGVTEVYVTCPNCGSHNTHNITRSYGHRVCNGVECPGYVLIPFNLNDS